jgi:hypothetical protein
MNNLIWKMVNCSEGPDRRAAHSAVFYKRLVCVFGGWNGLHALDDVVTFNTIDQSWRRINCTGEPPNERNNHAVALVGDKMYVHGGHDGVTWLDDLFCLGLDSLQWQKPRLSDTKYVLLKEYEDSESAGLS